jgi:hypothetical protein
VSLAAGTRVGPYAIVETLGEGGMGQVYRARDTRLDRDVAIKILPELFAADPERLARFEREAKTLASLNHPHIAQIHGGSRVCWTSGRGSSRSSTWTTRPISTGSRGRPTAACSGPGWACKARCGSSRGRRRGERGTSR